MQDNTDAPAHEAYAKNYVMRSTMVMNGSGVFVVTAVGDETEIVLNEDLPHLKVALVEPREHLGLYIGIIGCGGLAGFVAGKGGESWRVPFWIFGGIGLAWAVALAIFLRDTKPVGEEGKGNSEKGKSSEGSISGKPTIGEAFKAVFSKPTALCATPCGAAR